MEILRKALFDAEMSTELFYLLAVVVSAVLLGSLCGWIVRKWNLDDQD
jgi:hypothetical protein